MSHKGLPDFQIQIRLQKTILIFNGAYRMNWYYSHQNAKLKSKTTFLRSCLFILVLVPHL